jgi:hypothetical protein
MWPLAIDSMNSRWVVDRDNAHTVSMYRLVEDSTAVTMPLAWLLQSSPKDHLA